MRKRGLFLITLLTISNIGLFAQKKIQSNVDYIEKYAKKKGIPLLRIAKDTPAVTADILRGFLSDAGVHLYTDAEAVVFASESYVFLHAARDGVLRLTLPEKCSLTEVFTGESISEEIPVRCGQSLLLRKNK